MLSEHQTKHLVPTLFHPHTQYKDHSSKFYSILGLSFFLFLFIIGPRIGPWEVSALQRKKGAMESRAITWQALYSLAQVPAAQSQLPHLPPFSFAHVPAKLHMPRGASTWIRNETVSNTWVMILSWYFADTPVIPWWYSGGYWVSTSLGSLC
jgi:hypothetical protein